MASTIGTLNLSRSVHKKSSYPPTGGNQAFYNVDTATILSSIEPVSPLNSGEQTLFRNKSMFSPQRRNRNTTDASRKMLQTSRPNFQPKIEADSSRLQAALEHVQTQISNRARSNSASRKPLQRTRTPILIKALNDQSTNKLKGQPFSTVTSPLLSPVANGTTQSAFLSLSNIFDRRNVKSN